MVQKFVVGTLATIQSVVAPLGGSVTGQPVYKLEINEAHVPSSERCPETRRSFLGLQVEPSADRDFTLHVKGHICRSHTGQLPISLTLRLPADLLDEEFIEKLPPGAGYVVSGISVAGKAGEKARVKITRGTEDESLIPIQIEWLPDDGGRVAHAAMKFWFDPSAPNRLPWRKIELHELKDQVQQPLLVSGELSAPSAGRRRF